MPPPPDLLNLQSEFGHQTIAPLSDLELATLNYITMSATAARAASKVTQAAGKAAGKANEVGGKPSNNVMNKGARRDPELYVCSYHKAINATRTK